MEKVLWETAHHSSNKTARTADVEGHRLYVRRTALGARRFAGYIDGNRIGTWDTIDAACAAVTEAFKQAQ